jgi:hypothetical protein
LLPLETAMGSITSWATMMQNGIIALAKWF